MKHTSRQQSAFHTFWVLVNIIVCFMMILQGDTAHSQGTEVMGTAIVVAAGGAATALTAVPLIGAAVYAGAQAPLHAKSDTRTWSFKGRIVATISEADVIESLGITPEELERWCKAEAQASHHKETIRSWELHLFKTLGSVQGYAIYSGFCSPLAAMAYAIKIDGLKSWKVIKPSPLPCTTMLGLGAWGTP